MVWQLRCIPINWWDLPLITSFQTPQSWPFLQSSAETGQSCKHPVRQDTRGVWPMATLLYPWGCSSIPPSDLSGFGLTLGREDCPGGSHFLTLKVRWRKRGPSVGFSLWKYCRSFLHKNILSPWDFTEKQCIQLSVLRIMYSGKVPRLFYVKEPRKLNI